MSRKKLYWRVNDKIRGPMARVIDENGKQLGVMPIKDALEKARKAKLDLVEIAPNAQPPVVKIIDFGKFRYEQEKKRQEQKKKTKASELKEVRFSPFIGEADYVTRIERIRQFLNDKNKIKVVVKFKGRQMNSKKFGYELMKRILDELGEGINIDMEPKFIGRHLTMVISPTSAYAKTKD